MDICEKIPRKNVDENQNNFFSGPLIIFERVVEIKLKRKNEFSVNFENFIFFFTKLDKTNFCCFQVCKQGQMSK
jgi:hypothetical protein